MPLGLVLAGLLCDRFGMRVWFLTGGIAYLIVAFGSMLSHPIMNLEVEGDRLRSSEDEQLLATESAMASRRMPSRLNERITLVRMES